MSTEKFISHRNGVYRLDRRIDGKRISGSFKSLEDAVAVRDIYDENGWSLDLSHLTTFFINGFYYVLYKPDKQLKILLKTESRESAEQFVDDYVDMSYLVREKSSKTWSIKKSIKDRNEWFGSYKSLDEALYYRDLLREHGWDKEYFQEVYKDSEKQQNKYIYEVSGKYRIVRTKGDVQLTYGTYDTVMEARHKRDEYEANGWEHSSERFITNLFGLWWVKKDTRKEGKPYSNFYIYSEDKERILQASEYYLEHGFPDKPLFSTDALRYIRKQGERYYVEKEVNGFKQSFPASKDLFNAIVLRDILEEQNWNPSLKSYEKYGNTYSLDIEDDNYKLTLVEEQNKPIYKANGKFRIRNRQSWGNYSTRQEAVEFYNIYSCFGWDRQLYNALYVRERNKHISKAHNSWVLFHRQSNTQLYYHSLEDARFVRDYLVEHDWKIPYDECISNVEDGYHICLEMPPYFSYTCTYKSEQVARKQLEQYIYHGIDRYKHKYIRKINGYYSIITTASPHHEKKWTKGTKDYHKAMIARDILIDNEWEIPEGDYYFDGKTYNFDGFYNHQKQQKSIPNNIRKMVDKNGQEFYILSKTINGEARYFGSYNSLDKAIKMKSDLMVHDWSQSYFKEHYKQRHFSTEGRPRKYDFPKYIRKVGERYEIVKHHGGKLRYYGRYSSLDEAVRMRDKLVENGWSREVYEKLYYS